MIYQDIERRYAGMSGLAYPRIRSYHHCSKESTQYDVRDSMLGFTIKTVRVARVMPAAFRMRAASPLSLR